MNTREKAFGKFNQSRLKQVRARYLMSQEILSEFHLKICFKSIAWYVLCHMMQKALCLFMSLSFVALLATLLNIVHIWAWCGRVEELATICQLLSVVVVERPKLVVDFPTFLFLYVLIEVGYCMGFPIKLLGSRLGQWRPFPFYFVIIWNFLMLLPPPVVCIYATSNRSWSEWGFSYARPSFSSGEVIH